MPTIAGYTLDPGDKAAYFPVKDDGTGGWLPIGDEANPFVATFDGNGHSIRNLAIRRDQQSIGLFGRIGSGAVIGSLGLIDNLADYTGSSGEFQLHWRAGGPAGRRFDHGELCHRPRRRREWQP